MCRFVVSSICCVQGVCLLYNSHATEQVVNSTPPPPLPPHTHPQAVFKAYDTDNSGSISTEEFDAISSNFPFIEHFSVLDQDK